MMAHLDSCRHSFNEDEDLEELAALNAFDNISVALTSARLGKNLAEISNAGLGPLNSADDVSKRNKIRPIGINLSNCHYASVRRAARFSGLKEIRHGKEWTVCWSDTSLPLQCISNMEHYQKINHFPGMNAIHRKDLLARNMNRLLKLFPKEYNIFPRTWCLPGEYDDFQAYGLTNKKESFIFKPGARSQGKGIFLACNTRDIKRYDHGICQRYLSKPFLIDGFKFDLRVYVLVTSCDPLRIFLYKEGIVRFATTKYTEPSHANLNNVRMHLTNYAINKNSKNFIRNGITGSKRKISTLNTWLEDNKYDSAKLWGDIEDVVIKTLISALPTLKHNYRSFFPSHFGSACFELLGFDIILDEDLKPWLLEVNHSPSLATDSSLDREVKDALLQDTLNLINLPACDKARIDEEERFRDIEREMQGTSSKERRHTQLGDTKAALQKKQKEYEDSHLGGFRRIYPSDKAKQYDRFIKHSSSLYQQTTASQAKTEGVRQQVDKRPLNKVQKGIPSEKQQRANKDSTQKVLTVEKLVAKQLNRPQPCPPPKSKSMENKQRFTRPLVKCQEAEHVTVLPLPNLKSRDTKSHTSAQAGASHQSHFPRLLRSGGASLSPQYSVGRHAQQGAVTLSGVQKVQATAVREPVKPPARDSQKSLSGAKIMAEQKGTGCRMPPGIPSGSPNSSPRGGRSPAVVPRSGFLPDVCRNRSLVATSSSVPSTRRTHQSRQQITGFANVNRSRR